MRVSVERVSESECRDRVRLDPDTQLGAFGPGADILIHYYLSKAPQSGEPATALGLKRISTRATFIIIFGSKHRMQLL